MDKKIAIIASYLHPIRQKHLIDWYIDFSSNRKTVSLFLGSKSNKIPIAKNYKINNKREFYKYQFYNLFQSRRFSEKQNRIQPLINYKPEIIHLITSNAFQAIEPILENKKIQLIVSFRGFDINVFPYQSEENLKLTRKIFERADKLHFISYALRDSAIKLGANPDKCMVIYRSIQIDKANGLQINDLPEDHRLLILSVGRLVWEKGFLYALETMSILKNKGFDFQYQIAGSGIDREMINYHIKRLRIENEVSLLGELSRVDVKKKLQAAQIYFQPSLSEALSLSLIEASYYGLPIISSEIGGIPEVVKNNVSGFLSAPCNPEGYALNFIRLMENKDLRYQMGQSGYKIVQNLFSRQGELQKWDNFYEQLCR
ncbi:glycosyltransferase family 4 protein [Aequorivita todarodis]|uniref:glycosyltransferase family 4 protein n=1 Tax=Aequorivita todarodis TaxID=2036821 RepID=UPI002350C7A1|nr:glycosyltransferase family 4 protein [Aequorivita todarodis]MDC8000095.1 glycosyltransferase family 4 protein [Aequorivita todarodis]